MFVFIKNIKEKIKLGGKKMDSFFVGLWVIMEMAIDLAPYAAIALIPILRLGKLGRSNIKYSIPIIAYIFCVGFIGRLIQISQVSESEIALFQRLSIVYGIFAMIFFGIRQRTINFH